MAIRAMLGRRGDKSKVKEGVTDLTSTLMSIQAAGDYAKAKALGERLGIVRPPVQRALEKLASIPVDIEPRFSTAAELVRLPSQP